MHNGLSRVGRDCGFARRRWVGRALALGVTAVWLAAIAQPSHAQAPGDSQAQLRSLIEIAGGPEARWTDFAEYQDQVRKFYSAGGDALVWTQSGQPTSQGSAMIAQFKQARGKGLDPNDYDAPNWDGRLARLGASAAPADLANFDLILTYCAMRYISDLHIGRVNPENFKFGLNVGTHSYDLPDVLRAQVRGAADVDAVIRSFEPPYAGYQRTETALADYLKLAVEGDGKPLPMPAKSIRPRNLYAGMAQLRWRLEELGDLPISGPSASGPAPAGPDTPEPYTGDVVDAVKHFQKRHGLEPDGVMGKGTISALNTPLSQRVEQLELTLERYRWIPPSFPQPPVVVNIPEFRLRTMRRQPASYLTMRVVVGKAYHHRTPIFAQNMRYVIFRPYWEVPPSIQQAELVPKIRRNPGYLAENNYEVVDNSGGVVTDGAVSDDVLHGLRSGAYRIRQKPGPKNALGLIKFIFPNAYNVYLHSTPSQQLFARARRDFSHGCIRVENPVGLAVWVLRDIPGWTAEKVEATMQDPSNDNHQIILPKPIPVLILYSTAVVEPDGQVRFFDDIYDYDAELEEALQARSQMAAR